jgi:hypothetical protein
VTGDDDDRHVGARADLPQQVQPVLLAEPKIEDHQTNLVAVKLTDHLLATGRHKGTDVVLAEIA